MQTPPSNNFRVESLGKLTFLFFASMGFYSVYWFYRSWSAYEVITGNRVFKIGRTLFAVFYVHQLLQFVQSEQKTEEQQHRWNPIRLARLFIGTFLAQVLMALFFDMSEARPSVAFLVIFTLSILLVKFYVIYTSQLVMNRIAGDPFGSSNSRLTPNDFAWIAFGLYLWVSNIHSLYLISTGQMPLPPPFSAPQVETPPDNSAK